MPRHHIREPNLFSTEHCTSIGYIFQAYTDTYTYTEQTQATDHRHTCTRIHIRIHTDISATQDHRIRNLGK